MAANHAPGDSSSCNQLAGGKVVGNDGFVLIRSIASAECHDDFVSGPQAASPPVDEFKMLVLTEPLHSREHQVARLGTHVRDDLRDVRQIDASDAISALCQPDAVDWAAIQPG